MADWRIERLTPAHERAAFFGGRPSLDEFIRHRATPYKRRNLDRTLVAVRPPEPTVGGYYTLAGGSVAFASVPDNVSRGEAVLPGFTVPIRDCFDQAGQRQA